MDTVAKVVILILFSVWSNFAWANYPAAIVENSYCYTANVSSYSCVGPRFGDPVTAAKYACQQITANTNAIGIDVTPTPIASPGVTGPNGAGLTSHGTFSWYFKCAMPAQSDAGPYTHRVQALPDCSYNPPVVNYAPASCAGDPPTPPPLACSNTEGLTITAFHAVPAVLEACYASCQYSASVVALVTYNGMDYMTGSWIGKGQECSPTDTYLTGGIPGNAQNVGSGGGLSANDLLGLARENTLQELLSNARQSAALDNKNSSLLEAIKVNTQALVDKPSDTDMTDTEGFEAEYRAKVAAVPDTPGGALQGLPTENIDVTNTFNNVQGFIAPNCPAGPTFTVKNKSYQFDLSPLCQLATGLSYMIVTLAALAGVRIFIGGAYK